MLAVSGRAAVRLLSRTTERPLSVGAHCHTWPGSDTGRKPMTDNAPVQARAAILVSTGEANLHGNGLPSMVVVKDDLSEADFSRYDAANKTLDRILVTNLFTYYLEASKTLVGLWQEATHSFAAAVPIMGMTDVIAAVTTQLRGAVLNVVSMLCYHQERTLDEVCEKYRHDSEQHTEVKRIFNALYDDYFGYRYLCRLRNVMVHDTMESVSLRSQARRNKGQPVAFINLDLARNVFLKSPKINAKLKAELASKPGDPSVIQMMTEIHRPLIRANRTLLAILHPDLTSVCETVVEFDSLFEGKEGTRGLVNRMSPEVRPGFSSNFTPWSEQVIDFARNYATEDWNNPDEGEALSPEKKDS